MPVAWANRQFYDSGLGLGPRLPSFETPGPGPGGYRMEIQNDTGSVALWNEDDKEALSRAHPANPFQLRTKVLSSGTPFGLRCCFIII